MKQSTVGIEQMRVAGLRGVMDGAFQFNHLRVIVSHGYGWDHVSVSCQDRCPTWDEMERIKRIFFKPDETAMQLHVAEDEHISHHPYCLHMWRPQAADEIALYKLAGDYAPDPSYHAPEPGGIPLPPSWMVAPRPPR